MTALTGRRMTDDERIHIERWPVECCEEVTRRHRGESWQDACDKVAVAVRYDPNEGGAYPVCAQHARGEMATLADLLGLWDFCGGTDTADDTAGTGGA